MMSSQRQIFGPTREKRPVRIVIIVLLVAFFIWFFGLFAFVSMIPNEVNNKYQSTDAIVVLTGGSDRLKQGLTLLTDKKAKKLFVSGVYRGNDVRRLLKVQQHNPAEVLCCINLGYAATSTAGNAIETASWIKEQGYGSIRLVTASYHMPRSLMEFRHIMPSIKIIPHPVFPVQFKRSQWWAWPGTAALTISEYTKFSVATAGRKLEKMGQLLADGSSQQ
jgi:uncharacterized SAM-binding protein YcdF (DUF218 family)